MQKFLTILIATTAMSAATAALSGGMPEVSDPETEFFWTDISEPAPRADGGMKDPAPAKRPAPAPAPAPRLEPAPAPSAGLKDPAPARGLKDDGDAVIMAESYPAMIPDGCEAAPHGPHDMVFAPHGAHRVPRGGGSPDFVERRGQMTGDDGILEGIQDRPCPAIYRRGYPTTGGLKDGDINRANTLEDRRIPVHKVGRYAPEGSSAWYRDADNPFLDSSREWHVERGMMLSDMLMAWGEEAGFSVVWRSPHDYVLQTDVIIRGTFPEAAGQVIESFADANPPISGDFYLSSRSLVVDSASEFDGR